MRRISHGAFTAAVAMAVGVGVASTWAAQTRTAAAPGTTAAPAPPTAMRVYALRLRPGQDLKKELDAFVRRQGIRAGCVVTCVGSLTRASVRHANKDDVTSYSGHFEIVSLVGTLEPGGGHLHVSLSDGEGKTFGGHLMDGPNTVYTTVEMVIGDLTGYAFTREKDPAFGYNELTVRPRAKQAPRRRQ